MPRAHIPAAGKATAWKRARSIACLRLDNFGDVLMTEPALRAMKETFPRAHLTLVTSTMARQIAPLIESVDDVLLCNPPWNKYADDTDSLPSIVRILKKHRFDAAIVFTNFSQSALPAAVLCRAAGIERLLAYSNINPQTLISDWVPDHEPFGTLQHGVERQLALVAAIGATTNDTRMKIALPQSAQRSATTLLKKFGVNDPFIILHPGVSDTKRMYPWKRFAHAGAALVKKTNHTILVTGSRSERALCAHVAEGIGPRAYDIAGATDIVALSALIQKSDCLISNNTGPVHLAAAVGTPVVDLYARTNPEHTPWRVAHRTLYFDVPKDLQTRSPLLQLTIPKKKSPFPIAQHITTAALELVGNVPLQESALPASITHWHHDKD